MQSLGLLEQAEAAAAMAANSSEQTEQDIPSDKPICEEDCAIPPKHVVGCEEVCEMPRK